MCCSIAKGWAACVAPGSNVAVLDNLFETPTPEHPTRGKDASFGWLGCALSDVLRALSLLGGRFSIGMWHTCSYAVTWPHGTAVAYHTTNWLYFS